MEKKRVFVSFDFDNDKALKDFIVGQAKNPDSPFQVSDWSMKESAPESNWEAEARARIKRSDIVIVMLGYKTYQAPGVLKEVKIARGEGIKIIQIIGHKDAKLTPVPNAGTVYSWNWENLRNLLS